MTEAEAGPANGRNGEADDRIDTGLDSIKAQVVAAALPEVPFDGWTDRTLAQAVRDAGVDPGLSRLAFPRGGVDLALAFHMQRDAELAAALAETDLSAMRFRDRVGRAVEIRLELIAEDREAVRRGVSLLALPLYAADGARAVWHTADTIWTGLGDTSDDVAWYTKRATLSGVWSASVLYWLGDESPGMADTRAFIARRIDDVMQVEKVKSAVDKSPLGRAWAAGPGRLMARVRAPRSTAEDLPGRWD